MTRRFTFLALVVTSLMSTPVLADGWFWGRGHMDHWFRSEMGRCDMMGGGGMMGQRFGGERLEALKAELAITTAQETAWQAYEKVVRENADNMLKAHEAMMGQQPLQTLPERIDAQSAMMAAHQDAMGKVREATLALYQVLDAGQKKKADELILGMGMM
jgi:LTXXQ motif family protein